MNHYLCRARRIDNGEWVEGHYVPLIDNPLMRAETVIFTKGGDYHRIDPKTLQKCTGWTDKNNKLIFIGQYAEDRDELRKIRYSEAHLGFVLDVWVKHKKEWHTNLMLYNPSRISELEFFDSVKFNDDGSWERVR